MQRSVRKVQLAAISSNKVGKAIQVRPCDAKLKLLLQVAADTKLADGICVVVFRWPHHLQVAC
jgi:hypothetical protein